MRQMINWEFKKSYPWIQEKRLFEYKCSVSLYALNLYKINQFMTLQKVSLMNSAIFMSIDTQILHTNDTRGPS